MPDTSIILRRGGAEPTLSGYRGPVMVRDMARAASSNASSQMPQANMRAVGGSRVLRPERTFWQMFFALGTVEKRLEVTYESVETEDGWERRYSEEIVDFEFDAALLESYMARHRVWQQHSARSGMPPQPLPVSYMHEIEFRLMWDYAGWSDQYRELIRAGNIHDLYAHLEGDDERPAGIYGLVEWTPRAMQEIEDGTWAGISPTTWAPWRETDGFEIEEESIRFAALVDVGALNNIGTPRDRLPPEAFPLPADVRFDGAPVVIGDESARAANQSAATAATRSATMPGTKNDPKAQTRNAGEEPAETTETDDSPLTRADVQSMIDSSMDARFEPITEQLESIGRSLETLTQAAGEEAPPAEGDGTTEPAEAAGEESEEATIETAARKARATARRLATTRADEAVLSGRLLAADYQAFCRNLIEGDTDAAAALLRDYSVFGERQGHAGSANGSAAPAPRSQREVPTEDEILAAARAAIEKRGEKVDARSLDAEVDKIMRGYEQRGIDARQRG